jgi:predicted nucleic acid-binding protein
MLYLDTNVLIYLLEGHRSYAGGVADTLESQTQAGEPLVTSIITVAEFYAGTKSEDLTLLRQIPRLQFIVLNMEVAEQAALIQKNEKLLIGDAIHLATAIWRKADTFFTNDKALARAAGKYLAVMPLA